HHNGCLARPGRNRLRVTLVARGRTERVARLARPNHDPTLVIDHPGLEQPFVPPAPKEPWKDLPKLLALAECPNVMVKITGACTLSHESFPYRDIREPLGRIFDAFTLERCMWGTDWTRAVNLITYKDGVDSFRAKDWLGDSDRAKLMGGSLEKIYGWSPKK
ncbi:MAG: amidohydrolase family protein, partial [Reyranella sp.]|nr:amidohydrolase family protein [Reyranella sp.]